MATQIRILPVNYVGNTVNLSINGVRRDIPVNTIVSVTDDELEVINRANLSYTKGAGLLLPYPPYDELNSLKVVVQGQVNSVLSAFDVSSATAISSVQQIATDVQTEQAAALAAFDASFAALRLTSITTLEDVQAEAEEVFATAVRTDTDAQGLTEQQQANARENTSAVYIGNRAGTFNIREIDLYAGDGVTDATPIFQEAIAYAKQKRLLGIELGAGTFLTDFVDIPNGMVLSGIGHGSFGRGSTAPGFGSDYNATVIKQRNTPAGRHFICVSTSRDGYVPGVGGAGFDRVGPFGIRDMIILGNDLQPTITDAIRLQEAEMYAYADNAAAQTATGRATVGQSMVNLSRLLIRNFTGNGLWLPCGHGGFQFQDINSFFNQGCNVFADVSFGNHQSTRFTSIDGDANLGGNVTIYGMGVTSAASTRSDSVITFEALRAEQRLNPNAFAVVTANLDISGTDMLVTGADFGGLAAVGNAIEGSGIAANTTIIGYNSGTNIYTLNNSQTFSGVAMMRKAGTKNVLTFDKCESGTAIIKGLFHQSILYSDKPNDAIILKNHTIGYGPKLLITGPSYSVSGTRGQNASPDPVPFLIRDEVLGKNIPYADEVMYSRGAVRTFNSANGKSASVTGGTGVPSPIGFATDSLQIQGDTPVLVIGETDTGAKMTLGISSGELQLRSVSADGNTNTIHFRMPVSLTGGTITHAEFVEELRIASVLKFGATDVVLRATAALAAGWTKPTGTRAKGGYTVYDQAVFTTTPTLAEFNAMRNSLVAVSQTLAGLIDAIYQSGTSHGLLKP